jgi:hypothetical protein
VTAIAPARPSRTTHERGPAAPARRPEHRRGQHLRPVERPRPKRSPAVPALVGVGMVIAALLVMAGMHAVLIGGQVRLDAMRSDVAAEHEAIRRLELRVAELESPDRVLDAARDRLGMVLPTEVGYLLPVGVEGAAAEAVRVEPAVAPEAETAPEDGSETAPGEAEEPADEPASAEKAEVDAALDGSTELAADQPSEGGRDE